MICPCVTESRQPGWILVRQAAGHADYEICPECGGSLIASCCDAAGRGPIRQPPLVGQIIDALARPPLTPDELEDEEF